MAEDKIKVGISAEIAPSGDAPIKSIKEALRQAIKEAQTLSAQDMGSKEAIEAQQKVASLKEEMSSLNERVEALNPESKFKAFGQVAQGIAGGFSAAQGAAALFGAESEDLQKSLLKVQSALAISEGINTIMGLGDAFSSLAVVVKTNVVAAFSSMKAALVSSGIGALAIALGVIISKIIDYNDEIDAAATFQERYNKALKETNDLLQAQADKTEALRNARRGGINELQNELKILAARGASEQTLAEKRDQILQKELYNLKVRLATVYNDGATEVKIKKDIDDKLSEIEANRISAERSFAMEEVELQRAKLNAMDDNRIRAIALENLEYQISRQQAYDDKIKLQQIEVEHQKRLLDIKLLYDKKDFDRQQEVIKQEKQAIKDEIETIDGWSQEEKDKEVARESELNEFRSEEIQRALEIQRAAHEKELEIAKNTFDARVQLSQAFLSLLDAANGAAGDNAEMGKAIAVASATIDTYAAINKTLAAFAGIPIPGYAILQAVAIGVTGFANVAKILSTKVPSTGGGGKGNSSGVSISPPTFSPPQLNQTNGGQDISAGSTQTNTTQRVYVLESDISKSQRRVSLAESRSEVK